MIDRKYLIGGLIGLGVGAAIGAGIATAIVLTAKKRETEALDEAVLLDLDGDGEADARLADTTGDGQADTVEMDTTGDGQVDTILVDLDGDGEPDVICTENEALKEALEAEDAPAAPDESEMFADAASE